MADTFSDSEDDEARADCMLEASMEELQAMMASQELYRAAAAGDQLAAMRALGLVDTEDTENNADINYVKSGEYRTPLIIACRRQQVAMVKFLLQQNPKPKLNILSHGAVAVTHAFLCLQEDGCNTEKACQIISHLIDYNCDLNTISPVTSMTPLMEAIKIACAEGCRRDFSQPLKFSILPVIELLVDNGADVRKAEEFFKPIIAEADEQIAHYYRELFKNIKARLLSVANKCFLPAYQAKAKEAVAVKAEFSGQDPALGEEQKNREQTQHARVVPQQQ